MSEDRPAYTVYRSRRGLRGRLRPSGDGGFPRLRGPRGGRPGGGLRQALRPGRIIKYLLAFAFAWILFSVGVFFVSAQLQGGVSGRAERALEGRPQNLLIGSTVLVLGSDARPKGSKEAGAGGPSRADSILLLHAGFGNVRRLSILRDSYAQIPGHAAQKINASYALGGPALAVRTVEGFLGNDVEVNHVVEVSFENFRTLIDAMGGINVTLKRCVRAPPFSGRKFSLSRGEHRLTGRQALAFARVRKNRCSPGEGDEARAARQQQVLSSMRSRLLSPLTFPRLPMIAWATPRAIKTDMKGPGLSLLFLDLLTTGSPDTRVLPGAPIGPGGSLAVSEGDKARAVEELLGD